MNDPDCTCRPVTRRIPHNAECPRYDDEERAWSIEDRAERSWQDSWRRAVEEAKQ